MKYAELFPSSVKGQLGVMHLKRYWSKIIAKRNGQISHDAYHEEWNTDITLLNALGIGLEPALKFVFEEGPSFATFEQWVADHGRISPGAISGFNDLFANVPSSAESGSDTLYPLSADEWSSWKENGYLIIKNAVPAENCLAVVEAMTDLLDIDLNDPATWYKPTPVQHGIWVSLYQHPALQKNRDAPKIRAVYEQLWGRKDLWVNTDRVSFNPPETTTYRFQGPHLHWDVSLEPPIPFGLQGLLYLSDTAANQGAFTLVPGFHNRVEEWLNRLAPGADPRKEDLYALGPQPVAANAGDFIVWHHALPHGSSPNTSRLPRMVQYINYLPADFETRAKWT
ncbi:phytanoyl-CoA dioxygenase family protein [Hufsiella ginkgonis]|uniref:Phytanoyl-CoA dioxygenase n=1 Tax=Hufsiella ginkgonis TaxID=2695274 RepID=A0A7K1Y1C5_9SPHI|nr:phytanoyl-CoA dioxygenase family protein [Hufsiella ginkgonis]MXV17043.1 phytanoyl-CoA dioxygenase [Hufsiella ginkgonis]